jgi:ribosomal protein S18 acetylase RimI-like enzyme
MSVTFRPATIHDLEKLSDLVNSAYRGDSSKKGWTTEADLLGGQRTDPESLKNMISGNQIILLAMDVDNFVGCVYLKNEGKTSYLGMLTIHPGLQSGGLGRQLLHNAEGYVVNEWCAQKMRMTVISVRSELISWYERRGYRRTGHMEPFPYGDEKFGLPKRDDLEFEVLEKTLV